MVQNFERNFFRVSAKIWGSLGLVGNSSHTYTKTTSFSASNSHQNWCNFSGKINIFKNCACPFSHRSWFSTSSGEDLLLSEWKLHRKPLNSTSFLTKRRFTAMDLNVGRGLIEKLLKMRFFWLLLEDGWFSA